VAGAEPERPRSGNVSAIAGGLGKTEAAKGTPGIL